MIEAKFLLLLFFWTDPASAQDLPKWTIEHFISLEECEASALERIAEVKQPPTGAERVSHMCVHMDDFIKSDAPE